MAADAFPLLPPAKEIPSTFVASIKSWCVALSCSVVIPSDEVEGGPPAKRKAPPVRNDYYGTPLSQSVSSTKY